MICVGFLEELIFRGFLSTAMHKDGIKSAIIVSSLTFGIGHIVNLFKGSNAGFISTLCQVCYAIAFGLLFVIIFYKCKTLIPCILSHSTINALSLFSSQFHSSATFIIFSILLSLFTLTYTLTLTKTLNNK